MEDSSHELIDQMIAKEQYCYGFDNVSSINTNNPAVPSSQPQVQFAMVQMGPEVDVNKVKENSLVSPTEHKKNTKNEYSSNQSSASLPSHNQRWSAEEDQALVNAVNVYGYGHWKTISEHVKTRNSLQCKNRARQKIPAPPQKKKPNKKPAENAIIIPTSHLTQINFVDSNPPVATYAAPTIHSHQMLATIPEYVPANNTTEPKTDTTEVENVQNVQEEEPPKKQEVECDFDLEGITDHERKENTEWFMGKVAKTPERYKRIRNHIIHCWRKSSPNYLTKTAGRQNLADCGDVNAVGRIHAYLESIQVINVNCISPVKRTYGRSSHRLEDGSFRKKKIKKTPGFFWADVDDQDGEFEQADDIIRGDGKSRPKRTVKKPETFYSENGNESGHGNDPFTLVPVGYYPNQRSAPFTVNITSNALLVMELHSHLAYAEIIGLLGGQVVQNEDGSQQLKVEYVFPCRSTSTGIQCEMDPVSEMEAREVFEKKGLHVVGWYHSHPTFEPEPSIRDIENQTSYQDLFRDEVSGVEPFIGVIITPYNSRNITSDRSQFQFIHISKRWNSNKSYRLPFACLQTVTQCDKIPSEVVDTVKNLITEYKTYEYKIDMSLRYGDITRLDKLMRSLKNHLFMSPENNDKFLLDLKQMIEKNFGIESGLNTQESPQKQMDTLVHSLAI